MIHVILLFDFAQSKDVLKHLLKVIFDLDQLLITEIEIEKFIFNNFLFDLIIIILKYK